MTAARVTPRAVRAQLASLDGVRRFLHPAGRRARGYLLAIGFVAAITLVVGVAPTGVSLSHRSPIYFIAVLAAGALCGRGPAVLAAVLSFLAFDWFFVNPVHTFTVADAEEWQALLLFLAAALITGELTARLRERADTAERLSREHETLQREMVRVEVLKRTDELRAALLSAVSHDFRTPLAAIKAAAGSLGQRHVAWDADTRLAFAAQIEREADRLNRLVENLLDLSRIESGALKLDRQWYPLRELVEDTVDRLGSVLAHHPVEIDVPEDAPPVPLDYVLIQQVLANLLENAAKYAPRQTQIRVASTISPAAGEIEVHVEDRGPGLPAAERARVFAPFYRVTGPDGRATQTPSGAGYGLAVCAGFVAAHGGRIRAESLESGGAAFIFTLPVRPPDGAAAPHERAAGVQPAPTAPQRARG